MSLELEDQVTFDGSIANGGTEQLEIDTAASSIYEYDGRINSI